MICLACNFDNKLNAKFCGKCGSSFELQPEPAVATKTCRACQTGCKMDAKFCPKCGSGFSTAARDSVAFEAVKTQPAEAITPPKVEELPPLVAPITPAAELEPCPHCGAGTKKTAGFCGKCGKQISRNANVSSQPATALPVQLAPSPPVIAPKVTEQTITSPAAVKPDGVRAPLPANPRPSPQQPATSPKPQAAIGGSAKAVKTPLVSGKVLVMIGCALTAMSIAGGAYYALSNKATAKPNTPMVIVPKIAASAPSPAASAVNVVPAVSPAPSATAIQPAGLSTVAAPAPVSTTASASVSATATSPPTTVPVAAPAPAEKLVQPPVGAAEPAAPALQPKPEKKNKPLAPIAAPRDSTIDNAIAANLAEASQCMARKQYDCVIANTDGALRLDRGNARALELKRQAKEGQNRALSQIQIQ